MNDGQYTTIAGIIQFPPQEKTVNGKDIREVMIRSIGKGVDVRVTIWPEHAGVKLEKGDAIIVDGLAKQNPTTKADGTSVTYNNLSTQTLVVIPQAKKLDAPAQNHVLGAIQADVDSIF